MFILNEQKESNKFSYICMPDVDFPQEAECHYATQQLLLPSFAWLFSFQN